MNMVTSFNSKDMVGFANYIKSLHDRRVKKKGDPITSDDVENYRILKSSPLKESTTFKMARDLHDFIFNGWVKEGKWNDYQNSKDVKEFTFGVQIENNGFYIEVVEEHSNLCNRFYLRSDGLILSPTDVLNPLIVTKPIN